MCIQKHKLKKLFWAEVTTTSIFGIQFDESHHNKHFLLIDDVITTGSTLESCCRELMKIPGAKVSIVCMAMTQ